MSTTPCGAPTRTTSSTSSTSATAGARTPDLAALPPPRIFSTHIPYSVLPTTVRDAGCRIIYIARDPKDNFVSYWHFVQGLKAAAAWAGTIRTVPLDEALDLSCARITCSGPFREQSLSSAASAACNLGINRDGVLGKGSGFEKKLFFRKGEVGDWRNHLTPEMAEKVDRITREKLGGSGLSF